jgi:hypothetical protein
MTGHPGYVGQLWHIHEKTDTLIVGRQNGQDGIWRTLATDLRSRLCRSPPCPHGFDELLLFPIFLGAVKVERR